METAVVRNGLHSHYVVTVHESLSEAVYTALLITKVSKLVSKHYVSNYIRCIDNIFVLFLI